MGAEKAKRTQNRADAVSTVGKFSPLKRSDHMRLFLLVIQVVPNLAASNRFAEERGKLRQTLGTQKPLPTDDESTEVFA